MTAKSIQVRFSGNLRTAVSHSLRLNPSGSVSLLRAQKVKLQKLTEPKAIRTKKAKKTLERQESCESVEEQEQEVPKKEKNPPTVVTKQKRVTRRTAVKTAEKI